ncbi:MAG: DUF1826 domain-containing protein, partial [Myxococcaceae bacterium]|nr:DUF1826 domain-containing protein [Myxococcaceae bacterium]
MELSTPHKQARSRRFTGERHIEVFRAEKLANVRRPTVDLVTWRRAVDDMLVKWLDAVAVTQSFEVDERVDLDLPPIGRWLEQVPVSPGRLAFARDLALLIETWRRITKLKSGRVQLSTLTTRGCPRFHIDAVGMRMLCTYLGPGTEWIPEPALLRTALAGHRDPRELLIEGASPAHLERFDVGVFKGTARGQHRFGLVH